jgi:hypothetical protein
MDTKALGQDLVALGERLSGLQGDAIQTFSRRVQDRPAGAVLLALGIGTIFGFLLGLASSKMPFPGADSAGAQSRDHDRWPRDKNA